MDEIEDVTIVNCDKSMYLKPQRIHFKQKGREKVWDAMKVHDGVAIVIYNSSRDVFVCVRQFRPAVYIGCAEISTREDGTRYVDTSRYPGSIGVTYELCAGIVDKDIPVPEVAQEEVWEECGYKVPLENIHKITGFRNGVGTTGSYLSIYYTVVTDGMKMAEGGGNLHEGELIELSEIPAAEARAFIMDESKNKPVAMMFGLQWFMDNVYDSVKGPVTSGNK